MNRVSDLSRLVLTAGVLAAGAQGMAQGVLPRPEQPFGGHIGRTGAESTKDFPEQVAAPKGAPNILLIMTDDVGFGAASTFGGPIPTETMDRLAEQGLRFTNFHTTALSSPTRAALLSGRNHHSAATGVVMELGTGYPGYNTIMPKSCGTFAEILRQNGWNTAWYGKNHNVPDWQGSQAGPFDLWPTGLGFEYFYGFIGGDANQWAPALTENIKPIEPPHDDPNYHLDVDLADQCIARIRMLTAMAPDKPWVQYYVPGTAHAPHHAPKEWIDKFKGQFDQGWDKVREETLARQIKMGIVPPDTKLTERSPGIPAWDSATPEQKKVYARMMEVYAASLAHADHQMGRILDAIEEVGDTENTLVIYIQGDNGGSAEGGPNGALNELSYFNMVAEDFNTVAARMDELGGPTAYNHYPIGWAHAMCTPFQWVKQVGSHYGGTRNGVVISWPARIKDKGGIRNQFHHVIDIAPTILDACGVTWPTSLNGVTQKPVEGVSMAYTFDNPKAPSERRTQYFEMLGHRAIYNDGWVAATTPVAGPWDLRTPQLPIDESKWELYNVEKDFSQAVNLADKEPARLRALQDLFWVEAAKYNVLPIDNTRAERMQLENRPSLTLGRNEFTYFDGQVRIPEGAAPDVKNKSFKVTAKLTVPEAGAQGVVITQGGRFNGWGIYLLDSKPVFHYNLCDAVRATVAAKDKLAPGDYTLVADFAYDGGGMGKGGKLTITANGKTIAEGRIERTTPVRMSIDETMDIGEDTGTPVSEDYKVPFKFTGDLDRVTINLGKGGMAEADASVLDRAESALAISR